MNAAMISLLGLTKGHAFFATYQQNDRTVEEQLPELRFQFPPTLNSLKADYEAVRRVVFNVDTGEFKLGSLYSDMVRYRRGQPDAKPESKLFSPECAHQVEAARFPLIMMAVLVEERFVKYMEENPFDFASFDEQKDGESSKYTAVIKPVLSELLRQLSHEQRVAILRHSWELMGFDHLDGQRSHEDYSPTGKWFWNAMDILEDEHGRYVLSQSCNLDC